MWILGLKGLKTRYCPQNHMDLDWFYTIRSQPNPLDEQQGAVGRGHTSQQCGLGSGVSKTRARGRGRGLSFFSQNAVLGLG